MHYYKRDIGDYHTKAGRLSMLEHGSYTLLMDSCYDRERFPTLDEAIEWTWARTEQEIEAVKFVLSRFFELRDGVYVQKRIEEELARYKRNAEINARIAKEREEKRTKRARSVDEPSPAENEAPPNQELRTINQEPLIKNQEPKKEKPTRGDLTGFDDFWSAYPRKTSKAEAVKAFAKLKPDAELLATMLASLKEQAKSPAWTKDGGQFIPHASTWLNGRRWEDEVRVSVPQEFRRSAQLRWS